MSLASDVFGLLGSLLLVFPALRAADLLRRSYRVERAAEQSSGDNARFGKALAGILEGYTRGWNPRDYGAILAGIGCLVLSYLLSLLSHL